MELSIKLSEKNLNEAVMRWVVAKGFKPTDRFNILVSHVKGDQPGEPSASSILVTGIVPTNSEAREQA